MKQFDAMRKGLVGAAVLVAGWAVPGEAAGQERTIGVIRNAPERQVGVIGQVHRRGLSNAFVNTPSTRLVDLRRALGIKQTGRFVGGARPQPTLYTLDELRSRVLHDHHALYGPSRYDAPAATAERAPQHGVERYVTRSGMTITQKVSTPSSAEPATTPAPAPAPRPAYTTESVAQLDRDLRPGQLVLSVGGAQPVLITEQPAGAPQASD